MGYTIESLKEKILEMYPELARRGVASTLSYDKDQKAYVLKLKMEPTSWPPLSTIPTPAGAWTGTFASPWAYRSGNFWIIFRKKSKID